MKNTSRSTHYSTQYCCAWFNLQFGSGCACLMWCHVTCFLVLNVWFSLIELEKSEILQKPNLQRSRAGIPSMRKPAWRDMSSASVELCETEVCFLHIQLIGTNVWLPKIHKSPPDVDFESSRSPAKSESWDNPILHCCAVLPTSQYCLSSLVWWMYEIKRAKRLSQAFVHFVTARASLFTDYRISGLPIRTKYKHSRTIFEQTVGNSPTDPFSSSVKGRSSKHGVATWNNCSVVSFASSQYLSTSFFAWPSMSLDHEEMVFVSGFPGALASGKFSIAPAEMLDFKHASVIIHNIFAYLAFCLSATQIHMVKERCWFSHFNVFHENFPCWTNVLLLFSQFYIVHKTQIRITFFPGYRISILNSELFPNHVLIKLSRIALPTTVMPKDDRTDSVDEGQVDLPYRTMISAICVVVDVSKYLDILTLAFSITLVHLPFWLGCERILRLPLVLRIVVVLISCPYFCGCHLWCWWFSFSKYCVWSWIIFHNVTSKYNSGFVHLKIWLQLRILEMTKIHQWRNMNFSPFIPCFIDHFSFVSDFRQLPCRYLFQFFPFFFHCFLRICYFNAWGIEINLCTELQRMSEFIPFATIWSSWYQQGAPNSRGLVSFNNTSMFCRTFSQYHSRFPHRCLFGVWASEHLISYERSLWCSWSPHPQVQWRRYHVLVWHYRALVSR